MNRIRACIAFLLITVLLILIALLILGVIYNNTPLFVAALIVLPLFVAYLFIRLKNGFKDVPKENGFLEVEEVYLENMLGMPTRFSYQELKNVTNNFSNKLGEGGFGSVFHGTLPSGSQVAVKHLVGFGPVNKSFIAEVQTIGSIHHFNLKENHSRYSQRTSLYLHEDCHQKIIHFDIKPENILLDEKFNAKVSDFGLSKLIGRDQSQVLTTMRGTPGYMAPEWLTSTITEKVDVYSFGIVVLEILCGRRNIDRSQQEEDWHLLELFRRKQEEGQLLDLVDKCNSDMQSNAIEVVEMMKVVAWCLQNEYVKRPSMSTVVKLFEGSADVVSDNLNEDFLNGLILKATENYTSTILPSILSGPR
ncbi:hypothetical protein GOBAR_AA19459 [Gossypium barbadense]|uniref:non-specific serine/threonine protein kinase n=1 Tax=Gossypium barbadense TaxID=3634 RepID=A0A2P5XCZ6_GOSBA|nr:hypothetical protein GOBAR_AA19459 [Gossypium barbadense]